MAKGRSGGAGGIAARQRDLSGMSTERQRQASLFLAATNTLRNLQRLQSESNTQAAGVIAEQGRVQRRSQASRDLRRALDSIGVRQEIIRRAIERKTPA